MKKKLITICTMVGVLLVSASVATAINTVDPDAFSEGTDLSTAFLNVTLSSRGDGWSMPSGDKPIGRIIGGDPTNEPEPFEASTGDLSFFTKDRDYPHLFSQSRALHFRADFGVLATYVSLDFIGNDDQGDDVGVLQAYDSSDVLLGWDATDPLMISDDEMLSLSFPNIAYILAFGNNYETVGVDNLQWEPIPAPGAILLGSLGVGLVGWLRRRRTL